MKKILVVCMAVMLLMGVCVGCAPKTEAPVPQETAAAAVEEPQAGLPSLIHEVTDLAALLAAVPGVQMADAPSGAADVSYCYIDNEPTIAQIKFTLDGNDYTYRAAAASKEAQADISGVYEALDKTAIYTVPDGEKAGGTFTLKYAAGQVYGLSTWFYEPAMCQYSLYTTTGCDVSQSVIDVTRALLPLAAAAPTPAETTEVGVAQGVTVVSVDDGELVVNLSSGSTLQFSLAEIGDPGVRAGDIVDIEYKGELTDIPTATKVTIVQTVPTETQISGTVSVYDKTSVFVQADGGIVYGFIVNADTKYTGESNALKAGNTVTVTYTGDLSNAPLATTIYTSAVSAQPEKKDSSGGSDSGSLQNKRLAGVVKSLGPNYVTIVTSTGHTFTFGITSATSISEYYTMETGAKIRVTYDGYASDSPDAKKISVLEPKSDRDPVDTRYTMEGYVEYYGGGTLTIGTASGNEQSFAVDGNTRVLNPEYCISNYPVTVTYYGDESGYKYATKIVFRAPVVY